MHAWLQPMQARISVEPARLRLRGHLRVADQRPGHRGGIGVPAFEDELGVLRLVDPPGHNDRTVDDLLGGAGRRRGVAGGEGHRRHDVIGAGQGGRGALDDRDVVDQRTDQPERLERVVGGEPVG
ncbi:MAG: hypothetical protein V9F00_02365 [Nocardioides sp.]